MWVHLWASRFTNTWAEDISENIIVSKMSCFNHPGQLTVPWYSLSHSHWQGCLFCNILLMPMQQNIFRFTLSDFHFCSVEGLNCWSFTNIKYCRKVTIVGSILYPDVQSLHILYIDCIGFGFPSWHKMKTTTTTYHYPSVIALGISMYNWFVLF